jgi:hypothetical protein
VRDWIHASVSAGLIAVSNDQYRTLSLTDRGREFMHSRLPDAAIRQTVHLGAAAPHSLRSLAPAESASDAGHARSPIAAVTAG